MKQLLILALYFCVAPAHAIEGVVEESAIAIRAEDDRRLLALPKPLGFDPNSKSDTPSNTGGNCIDPLGRTTTNGGPFSETCKGPAARY
jgi:hypothetical protein